MKGHTLCAPLVFIIFALTVCFLTVPAHAQTTNQAIFITFSINLIQGIDTIENPSGQALATEDDLLITNELPADLEAQIAGDPIYNFPPYVQANLPSMIGNISDYSFLIDGGGTTDLPDYSPTLPPALLLSTSGTITSIPSIGPLNVLNAISDDLVNDSHNSAPVASNALNFINNDQFFIEGTDPSGVQPAEGVINVNYYQDNIVQVSPETSSILLLVAGLAAFGLFAWTRKRRASQA